MEFNRTHIVAALKGISIAIDTRTPEGPEEQISTQITVALQIDDNRGNDVGARGVVYEGETIDESLQRTQGEAFDRAIRACTTIHKLKEGDALKNNALYKRVMLMDEAIRARAEYVAEMGENL
jgi:hypothetical protein